ncbi:MAG: hypothetical protein Unbinned6224contig1001_32 [Prokaryotic dsDNA virus sp.]|nr:MAG: hypothetical protein Unbinned6224contig1001_32 [Prokaryotic dsDNA virus sp.]|tara:strand:- start:670 stop:927 length:258 start_codon:yes stop_codon:yes gene_type:complete
MARIKFANTKVDKGMSHVSSRINSKEVKTRVTTGIVNPQDIQKGQFVFTSIKKGQEGPSSPTQDESRIYFKDKNGDTFMFTGTKV